MKEITIYRTAIKVSEDVTLNDLTVVGGFEELLDSNIPADRFKEISDAFRDQGVEIRSVFEPDGFTDETLISKDVLKVFLNANKGDSNAFGKYFDMPSAEIDGIGSEDLKTILPLFKAAQHLGISIQIKTCSDEDFREMSEVEARNIDDTNDIDSPVTLNFS